MKRILITLMIMLLAVTFMPLAEAGILTGGDLTPDKAYGATTINTIDLTYDATKVISNTHFTESEIHYAFLDSMGTTTKGVELQPGESSLQREWEEKGAWGWVSTETTLDDRFEYAVCFGMYISDDYDLPSSITTYAYTNASHPAKISNFSGFTVNVNGTKRDDAYIYYNAEGYRTLLVYVPIGTPSTEEIKPTIQQISILDTNETDITNSSIDLGAGDTYTFTAEVTGLKLEDAHKGVIWTLSGAKNSGTTVDSTGKVTISPSEPLSTGAIKLTATSTYDSTKSSSTTINISNTIKTDIAAAVDNDDSGTYSGIETSIKKAGTPGTVWITGLKDKKYTGKKIKQSVTLKFNNTKMKAGTDYKITYKNNKNVGTAIMTIKGRGKYYGTYTVTFKINPKPATISKITPAKKSATIKWKAVKTKMSKKKITGYKIQYSTSSKFKKSATKTKTIKGSAKTSVKIKNLKAKKKYYFRIRTYMKVDGKTYYSTWSKVKNVKVK